MTITQTLHLVGCLLLVSFSSFSEVLCCFFVQSIFLCLILSDSVCFCTVDMSVATPVLESSGLMWKMPGVQHLSPPWSPVPGTVGVSFVWAGCTFLL